MKLIILYFKFQIKIYRMKKQIVLFFTSLTNWTIYNRFLVLIMFEWSDNTSNFVSIWGAPSKYLPQALKILSTVLFLGHKTSRWLSMYDR